MQAEANGRLALIGYLVTMFNKALSVHVTYEGYLRELHGDDVFAAVVPHAKDYKEAVTYRKPIVEYKPKSAAAQGDGGPGRRVPGPARRQDSRQVGRCPEGRLMASFKEEMRSHVAGSMRDRIRPTSRSRPGQGRGRRWSARARGGDASTPAA